MKLEIYDPCKGAKKEEATIPFQLGLVEEGTKVYLAAVNPDTGRMIPQGRLVGLDSNGSLVLCGNINPKLGIKLEDRGRLKISNL